MTRDLFKILFGLFALSFIFSLFLLFSALSNKEEVVNNSSQEPAPENTKEEAGVVENNPPADGEKAEEVTSKFAETIIKDANKEEVIDKPIIKPISYAEYIRNIGGSFSKPIYTNPKNDSSAELNETTKTLKEYGNSAGVVIKNITPDGNSQVEIFDNFLKNLKSEVYLADIKKLAGTYKEIGALLSEINAPSQINIAHNKLSRAYEDLSTAIISLSDGLSSGTDPKEVTDNYGKSINKFPEAYIGVASTLRAYGIEFKESEPGSVFTLPI